MKKVMDTFLLVSCIEFKLCPAHWQMMLTVTFFKIQTALRALPSLKTELFIYLFIHSLRSYLTLAFNLGSGASWTTLLTKDLDKGFCHKGKNKGKHFFWITYQILVGLKKMVIVVLIHVFPPPLTPLRSAGVDSQSFRSLWFLKWSVPHRPPPVSLNWQPSGWKVKRPEEPRKGSPASWFKP